MLEIHNEKLDAILEAATVEPGPSPTAEILKQILATMQEQTALLQGLPDAIGEGFGARRGAGGVMPTARLLPSHAVQAQCRSSPSHPARPLPRHELASLRGRTEATWRSHTVAGRGGRGGLVSAEAKHARRPADLLRPGDRTRADAAPRLSLGPAPGR